eukprot:gene23106-35412_t
MVKVGRHDPNNTTWSKNKNRLGFKLLEKMGWSEGKGLGKKENGTTEHVRVKAKDDNSGLGTALDVSSWRGNTTRFEETLQRLQTKRKGSPKQRRRRATSASSVESVESKASSVDAAAHHVYVPPSPVLRAAGGPLRSSRCHYNRKTVKAKQEFKTSDEAKRMLTGKIHVESKAAPEVVDTCTKSTHVQLRSEVSMDDYFAQM